jgi:hypothetical protein
LLKAGLSYNELYINARTRGRAYAKRRYNASIFSDYNFFLSTTEAKTENMIRLAQRIEDKSSQTLSVP